MKKVKKAIIPVAGFGTRFLPITKSIPKCMLPINGKPIIQFLVEEIVEAGITEIIFITTYNKKSVEDYFDRSFELEYLLESKKKIKELNEITRIAEMADYFFVRQPYPRGDGFAILQAEKFVKDEPFMVVFEDVLHVSADGKPTCSQELIESFESTGVSTTSLFRVPKDQVDKYGIASGKIFGNLMKIEEFEEKPQIDKAKSNLAQMGKHVCTEEIMIVLKEISESKNLKKELTPKDAFDEMGKGNEIRLADAYSVLLKKGGSVNGLIFDGNVYDTGDKLGYMKAVFDLGVDEKMKEELSLHIKSSSKSKDQS